jgi:hypothetical protein
MRKSMKGLLVTVGLLAATTASAGSRYASPVVIVRGTTGGSAWGTLGTVHNSANTVEEIGCYAFAFPGFSQAWCYAYDVTAAGGFNQYLSCSTNDAGMIAAASNLKPDGYVSFSSDISGKCTVIYVGNLSTTNSKAP